MGKFLKQGKVVVVTQGRFAGRKAVILRSFDDGTKKKKFGQVLVAGIDGGPRKITRAMSQKMRAKRAKMRPFVKMLNFSHIMPTRYQVDFELKKVEIPKLEKEGDDGEVRVGDIEPIDLNEEAVADVAKRKYIKKAVKKVFEKAFFEQDKRKNSKAEDGVKYFYQKLKF